MSCGSEARTTAERDNTLRILAEEYFSKPMHALFKSSELTAINAVKLDFKRPVIDLGCGNGTFGSIFSRIYGLGRIELGLDLNARSARLANRRGVYNFACSSDLRALPIKAETFGFVFSNSVVDEISPGHELAIAEVARVLAPGGQLLMTVPTPGFTDNLIPKRLFDRLGLHSLAAWYSNGMNKRNGHRILQGFEVWRQELEQVGLRVENHKYYFSAGEAAWWSITAMRPFQLCAVLRYLPRIVQQFAARLTERLVRHVRDSIRPEEVECGYLLIVARKV